MVESMKNCSELEALLPLSINFGTNFKKAFQDAIAKNIFAIAEVRFQKSDISKNN
jgi:hypothetical protein